MSKPVATQELIFYFCSVGAFCISRNCRENFLIVILKSLVVGFLGVVGLIFSGVLIFGCGYSIEDADKETAKIEIRVIENAAKKFKRDTGNPPSTLYDLTKSNHLSTVESGPYVMEIPRDPWNNEYIYHYPAKHSQSELWDLYSTGPNGIDEFGQGDDIGLERPTDGL